MKKLSIIAACFFLVTVSLLASISFYPASSFHPAKAESSTSPTPTPTQLVIDSMLLTPNSSESAEALAQQAMLSVLGEPIAEDRASQEEIFQAFVIDGNWAYAVIEKPNGEGLISMTAHLLPDGTWEAAAPGIGGIDPQWLDAAPENPGPFTVEEFGFTQSPNDETPILLSLDGVDLNLHSSFITDPAFVTSEPDSFSQVATAVDRVDGYREIGITAVPYGTQPGTESLPLAQFGGADLYRTMLREYRENQEGNPQSGPTAHFFGQSVNSLASIVNLPVRSLVSEPVLIVEWVVEAGDRIWIIRVSQVISGEDTSRSQAVSSSFDLMGDIFLDSPDVNRPSTSLASRKSVAMPSVLPYNQEIMPMATDSDLPFPSWWDGDCDVNYFRAMTGIDSYQLGNASYRGMKACGPGNAPGYPYGVPRNFGEGNDQLEWQCAELSKRFLYLTYGIAPYPANGSQIVDNYSGNFLEPISNGTWGIAPQPNDVLSYGSTSTAGHTSVVVASNVDSSGNGWVKVIEQNSSSDGYRTHSVSDWWVNAPVEVTKWLHNPNDEPPGGACSAPSLIQPSHGAVLDNQTVTFSWNAVSGCTFDGYMFRVCTDPNVGDLNNCFIDTGEGGTQRTETISGWDDQDLYWGVRAANAPDGASWAVRHFRIEPGGGGGTCAAPSLIEPGNGATLNNRTVTFRWNAVSGCTFSGYTFRVCTDPDVGDLNNCFIDTGEGGTQRTEVIDGHDNQDLYWAVKAANAPDGSTWAVRHFRIEPGSGSGDVVMCTTDDASSGCWIFPSVGIYDLTQTDPNLNDQIRSILSVPSGMSVMLFREGGLRGTAECYNGTRIPLPEGHPWDLRGQVTDVQVFSASDCPSSELASVVLYDGVNFSGHHWGLGYAEGVHNMGDIGGTPSEYFNDRAESIRIPDGWSVRLYEHDDRGGQSSSCMTGDRNTLDSLNNMVSSVEVFHNTNCTYPAPAAPSNLTVGSPTASSLTLSWQDNSNLEDGFKIYRWGFDGTDWRFLYHGSVGANVTAYVDTDLTCEGTYFYEVSAYNSSGESLATSWSSGDTSTCPPPGPIVSSGQDVDDDMIENSRGNGDGVANCGEIIEFYTTLLNEGQETATGVEATISTGDPYVTWLYNTSSGFPDIPGGGMRVNDSDFDFALDASTPDGHVLQFTLDIGADHGGPWSVQYDMTVNCTNSPQVELYSMENYEGNVVFNGGTGFSNSPSADSYSMYIPAGWSVKTWKGDDRTNEERCWIGSISDLSWYGWENAIQSIEVFDFNACPEVHLYDDINYSGDSVFAYNPGRYTMEYTFNDKAESITMPSGFSVRLFKHNDYASPAICLTASDPDLGNNTYDDGTVVSNSATTMEIYDQPSCPPAIPAVPSNLEVGDETKSSLTLTWRDTSNNESGFRIYRWGYDGSDWDFLYLDSVGANITSYIDTGLYAGTTYYYEISAYNASGESLKTNWVEGTTLSGSSVYLPLIVTGTDQN